MIDQRLADLVAAVASGEMTRRQFLRRAAALGMSASAALMLLRDSASAASVARGPRALAQAQSDPRTLVVLDNLQANWLFFDTAKSYEPNPAAAMYLVYESLYHLPINTELKEFQPLLADGMPEFSADGTEVTIKLREGVTFHTTGNPVTADDWVFSWNRLANIKGNPSFLMTDNIAKVEATDPATLKLTLTAPNAAIVGIITSLTFAVLDSKALKANGGSDAPDADQTDTATDWIQKGNSVGTGPFMLTGWDLSGEVVLERNPDYWGEAPKVDKVIFRNVAETSTQIQLIQSGDADLAYAIDPDAAEAVASDPALQVLEGPSLAYEYLAMHTGEVGGPLAKKEARQAIAHAVDYEGIITSLLGGAAVRPATIVPLGLLGADEVKELAYQTDLEKAQQLWDASGAGTAELTLTFGADQPTPAGLSRDTLAAKLQSDLERIEGLTIKLNPMDPTQRLEDFRAGKLQFTMSDWSPDYPDVQSFAYPFGHTGGSAAKRVDYSNPQVDQWLEEGIKEVDLAKRTAIYVDIQEQLIEDVAFLTEFQPFYRSPASKNVQGVQAHALYILQLRGAEKSA
jgi:peptide/nickel transport system substrate-binding protein